MIIIVSPAAAETVAQVAGVPELVERLSQYGLLGVLLAIVVWALYKRDIDLKTAWAERIADAKMLAKVIETNNANMAAWTEAQKDHNRTMEQMARAVEQMAREETATTAALCQRLDRLEGEIRKT